MDFYRVRPKSGTTSQWKTTLDTKVNEVKKSVANGKNLIGNVVGGNQNSTFQVLANNAQTIKTDRDNKLSKVNNLNSQVSSLNTQLSNMTKDRDNWKNTANSKYYLTSKNITNSGASTVSAILSKQNDYLMILLVRRSPGLALFKIIDNKLYVRNYWSDTEEEYYDLPLSTPVVKKLEGNDFSDGVIRISENKASISIPLSAKNYSYYLVTH